MIPFLLVNIVVSALVVLGLWTYLQQRSPQMGAEPVVTIVIQENVNPVISAETQPSTGQEPAADPLPTPTAAEVAAPEVVESAEIRTEAVTHVVKAGELLGNIAVQYDVAVDQIVVANGLDNPNQIYAGQELIIPADTVVLETATEAAATPAPPTAVPTEEITTGEAALTIANVNGAGDLDTEHVEIINAGADAILLEGWTLTDDAGNIYTFGQVTLFGGGSGLKIYTQAGENGATDLYWGGSLPVWSAGKTVVIRDTAGAIQADFVIP